MASSSDPQKAIGYYRQALGLKAETSKGSKNEQHEYYSALMSNPENIGIANELLLPLLTGNSKTNLQNALRQARIQARIDMEKTK